MSKAENIHYYKKRKGKELLIKHEIIAEQETEIEELRDLLLSALLNLDKLENEELIRQITLKLI